MDKLEFRVCWHRPGACWLVRLSDEVRGDYPSQKQAVAGAIEAAGAARQAGYDAQVWNEAMTARVY